MLPGYMNALREVGAVPFMPALTTDRQEIDQIFGMCDGLVMTGGHDVNPECYGESDRYGNLHCCDGRDEMEFALLERAVASDKPVLGICRGLQIMNVFCGGTLYQAHPAIRRLAGRGAGSEQLPSPSHTRFGAGFGGHGDKRGRSRGGHRQAGEPILPRCAMASRVSL